MSVAAAAHRDQWRTPDRSAFLAAAGVRSRPCSPLRLAARLAFDDVALARALAICAAAPADAQGGALYGRMYGVSALRE